MFDYHCGFTFIPTTHMVETKTVNRSQKERWLTWPWKPWIKTKEIIASSDKIMKIGANIYAHPAKIEEIKRKLEKNEYGWKEK